MYYISYFPVLHYYFDYTTYVLDLFKTLVVYALFYTKELYPF